MNKNIINLIFDKYVNLLHTSIKDYFNNEKFITYVNKFINKFIFINKKISNSKINYKFLNLFNKILIRIAKTLNEIKSIDIVVSKILYPNLLIGNKLIIKISNFKNIIVYIPFINNIKINIDNTKNKLIHLSSKNMEYITSLASLIKNIKKIDACTGVGMYYSTEKIIFKRKIVNEFIAAK